MIAYVIAGVLMLAVLVAVLAWFPQRRPECPHPFGFPLLTPRPGALRIPRCPLCGQGPPRATGKGAQEPAQAPGRPGVGQGRADRVSACRGRHRLVVA